MSIAPQSPPTVVPLPKGVPCFAIFEGYGFETEFATLDSTSKATFWQDVEGLLTFRQKRPSSLLIDEKFRRAGFQVLAHQAGMAAKMGPVIQSKVEERLYLATYLLDMWSRLVPLREFCYLRILNGPVEPATFHREIQRAIDRAAAEGYILPEFHPSLVTARYLQTHLGSIVGDGFEGKLDQQIQLFRQQGFPRKPQRWTPSETKALVDAVNALIATKCDLGDPRTARHLMEILRVNWVTKKLTRQRMKDVVGATAAWNHLDLAPLIKAVGTVANQDYKKAKIQFQLPEEPEDVIAPPKVHVPQTPQTPSSAMSEKPYKDLGEALEDLGVGINSLRYEEFAIDDGWAYYQGTRIRDIADHVFDGVPDGVFDMFVQAIRDHQARAQAAREAAANVRDLRAEKMNRWMGLVGTTSDG